MTRPPRMFIVERRFRLYNGKEFDVRATSVRDRDQVLIALEKANQNLSHHERPELIGEWVGEPKILYMIPDGRPLFPIVARYATVVAVVILVVIAVLVRACS